MVGIGTLYKVFSGLPSFCPLFAYQTPFHHFQYTGFYYINCHHITFCYAKIKCQLPLSNGQTSFEVTMASFPPENPNESLLSNDFKQRPHTWHPPEGPPNMFCTDENCYESLASNLAELADNFDHKLAGTYPANVYKLNSRIAYVLCETHSHPALDHPDRPPSFCHEYLPRMKSARAELVKRGQNEREWGDQLWRLSDIIQRLENPPTGGAHHSSP